MTSSAPVGVVLAGGASSRMGTDKAVLVVEGVPMARRVADALVAGGCTPVLAVGGDGGRLASLGFEVLPDREPGAGPLGGLATAIVELERRGWSARDLVAVACDLPWLDAATVRRIVEGIDDTTADADVVCARTDRLQPLCALWRASSFAAVREAFDGGERAVRAAWSRLRVVGVPVEPASVRNVNSPSDLPGGSLPA